MATNQVLLLQPIKGLGAEGDTVTVRSGYARNFLLPRKIALPITQANKKQMEALLKAREAREAKELDAAKELAERISKTSIALAVKTGEGGKMFGAVTANDLITRLAEEGIELVKKQLGLPAPIKELGSHTLRQLSCTQRWTQSSSSKWFLKTQSKRALTKLPKTATASKFFSAVQVFKA